MNDIPITLSSSSDEELPETSFLLSSQHSSQKYYKVKDASDASNAGNNLKNELSETQQIGDSLLILETTIRSNKNSFLADKLQARDDKSLVVSPNILYKTSSKCLEELEKEYLTKDDDKNEHDDICDLLDRSLHITNQLDDDCNNHLQYTPTKATINSIVAQSTEKSNILDTSDTSIVFTRRWRQPDTKESAMHRRRNVIYDSDENVDNILDYNNSIQYTPTKSITNSFVAQEAERSNILDTSDTSIIFTRRQRRSTTKEGAMHRRRNVIYDSDENVDNKLDCNDDNNDNSSIVGVDVIDDDILPPDISQVSNFYTPRKDGEYSIDDHLSVVGSTPKTRSTDIHSTGNTPFFTPISTPVNYGETLDSNHTPSLEKINKNSVDLLVDQLDETVIISDDESDVESEPEKIVSVRRRGLIKRCCLAEYCQPLPPRITQTWVFRNISKPREHDISWLAAHRDITPLQFRRRREKLAAEFYRIFNRTVFDQLLPEDIPIIWCNRGRTTAGWCHTNITEDKEGNIKLDVYIRLAERVLDDADRLAETLLHEMTHAATFIINRTCKAKHGPIFRAWCKRINIVYPSLTTSSTHDYEINYKYQWQCTNPECNLIVGRHSKSLDITRLVCGKCRSPFVQIRPVPRQ